MPPWLEAAIFCLAVFAVMITASCIEDAACNVNVAKAEQRCK